MSYIVGPAASGRATCKTCKAKIDQGALRVGTVTPGPGDYDMTAWRHLECQKKPKINSPEEMGGYTTLSPELKAKVDAWFEAGGTAKKKRSAAELQTDSELEPKKMKVPELKKALKEHGMDATGSKAELQALREVHEMGTIAPHTSWAQSCLTQQGRLDEVKKRAVAESKYQAMMIPQLKAVLEANKQPRSGTKQELVERCVDGELFGALPRCPQCGGGTLRVVYASKVGHGGRGRFSCPGYYDDDHYVRCNYKADEADRIAWENAQAALQVFAWGAASS